MDSLDFEQLLSTCGLEAPADDTRAKIARLQQGIRTAAVVVRHREDQVDFLVKLSQAALRKRRAARKDLALEQRKLALVLGQLWAPARREE